MKEDAEALVEREARAVIDAPWPEPGEAGRGVFANEPARVRAALEHARIGAHPRD